VGAGRTAGAGLVPGGVGFPAAEAGAVCCVSRGRALAVGRGEVCAGGLSVPRPFGGGSPGRDSPCAPLPAPLPTRVFVRPVTFSDFPGKPTNTHFSSPSFFFFSLQGH